MIKQLKKAAALVTVFVLVVTASLSSYQTGAVAAETAPTYTKAEVTAYIYAKDKTEKITVMKRSDLPNNAWINVMDFLKYNFNDKVRFDISHSGDVYTVTKKNNGITMEDVNTTMVIDAAKDTVTFDKLEMFIVGEDAYKLSGATVVDNGFVQEQQPKYVTGSAVSATAYDLAKYHLDIVGDGDAVYMPITTISNMFGFNYNQAEFVDGAVYFTNIGNETGTDPENPYVNKSAIFNTVTRTAPEIALAYDELMFDMDELYGCPPHCKYAEAIKKDGFDKAVKADPDLSHVVNDYLMNADRVEYYQGLNYLTALLNDHGHTGMSVFLSDLLSAPVYAGTEVVKQWSDENRVKRFPEDSDKYNALIMATEAVKGSVFMARNEAYTGNPHIVKEWDNASYLQVGDKGIFSFDRFKAEVLPLLKEALDHAASHGVKEFWFDLSCNGGGDERVLAYMMKLITGDGTLYFKNAKTGNRVAMPVKADMNQDGVFDEKDDAVKYDFDYKVITSIVSFSCGNALPCMAADAGIPIYGQTSGGGTCLVYMMNHTDSMKFVLSGANIFSSPKTWMDVEAGAPLTEEWVKTNADGSYDYSDFYNIIMVKVKNTAKVTTKNAKVSAKKVKKKAITIRPVTVKNAQGDVSYAKVKGDKKITVNKKTGKVTVKKGTKVGKYTVKIQVKVTGSQFYKPLNKTVTVKISVK